MMTPAASDLPTFQVCASSDLFQFCTVVGVRVASFAHAPPFANRRSLAAASSRSPSSARCFKSSKCTARRCGNLSARGRGAHELHCLYETPELMLWRSSSDHNQSSSNTSTHAIAHQHTTQRMVAEAARWVITLALVLTSARLLQKVLQASLCFTASRADGSTPTASGPWLAQL